MKGNLCCYGKVVFSVLTQTERKGVLRRINLIEAAMNKERLVVTYASVVSETRIGESAHETVDTEPFKGMLTAFSGSKGSLILNSTDH